MEERLLRAHFFNWIDAKKLAVELTIPVHGPPATIAEFRKAVEEMKLKPTAATN